MTHVRVIDLTCGIIYNERIEKSSGSNSQVLNIGQLTKSVHMLRLEKPDQPTALKRLIIQ